VSDDSYEQLTIVTFPGFEPVVKPTIGSVDAFEASTGFKLPTSYRQFTLSYGPGELAEYLRIRAPGYPGDIDLDLAEYNRFLHSGDDLLRETYGQPELLASLWYFGSSFMGDSFGWNASEPTGTGKFEYAIYALPRVGKNTVKVALSFNEFVRGILQGIVMEALGITAYIEEKPAPSFQPHVIVPPGMRP
jgi:hypothetical protein